MHTYIHLKYYEFVRFWYRVFYVVFQAYLNPSEMRASRSTEKSVMILVLRWTQVGRVARIFWKRSCWELPDTGSDARSLMDNPQLLFKLTEKQKIRRGTWKLTGIISLVIRESEMDNSIRMVAFNFLERELKIYKKVIFTKRTSFKY